MARVGLVAYIAEYDYSGDVLFHERKEEFLSANWETDTERDINDDNYDNFVHFSYKSHLKVFLEKFHTTPALVAADRVPGRASGLRKTSHSSSKRLSFGDTAWLGVTLDK